VIRRCRVRPTFSWFTVAQGRVMLAP